eukprot:2611678-Pleurochrysis_carterae.AAC.1
MLPMRLSSNIAAAEAVADAVSPRCKTCNRQYNALCQPTTDRVATFYKGMMQAHLVRITC